MRVSTPPHTPLIGDPRLDAFVTSLHREDLAATTVRAYRHDLQLFARWFADTNGDAAALEGITQSDLLRYREYLVTERKARPATVNRRLESLRRFCRWAYRAGFITEALGEQMKPVRQVRRPRPKHLLDDEVHALLRAAGMSRQGLRYRNVALVHCLLQTGVRVGEVSQLRIRDVTVRDRTGVLRVRGKGRKERQLPLNASARRALREYLDRRKPYREDEPLFASSRGTPMSVRTLQHVVTELARRAGIDRIAISAHTLRHTFSFNFLRSDPGRIDSLALLLGHESLDTTAVYTRPSFEELADRLERSNLNAYR